MADFRRICVFCGSHDGEDPAYSHAAIALGGQRAKLADLLVHPGRLDVAERLAHDAVDVARGAGAASLIAWLPRRHPYRKSLLHAGILDTHRDLGIRIRPVRMPTSELSVLRDRAARVHYMLGDTDVV